MAVAAEDFSRFRPGPASVRREKRLPISAKMHRLKMRERMLLTIRKKLN
jgi:hypothetical protein